MSSRFIIGSYVIFTILLYFLMITPKNFQEKPYLFFQDYSLTERIHTVIISDHNGNRSFIARAFYNKATFLFGNIFTSFARSLDPVFIFGLTNQPYFDNYHPSPLPFWEFPIFITGCIVLIKKWDKWKRQLKYLLFLLSASLAFVSFFLSNFTLKYLPLVVIIELISGIGFYSLLLSFKNIWLKK
jgi:hypothetical protein